MTDHSAYSNAWVFTAIGGTKPEHGERLSLPEFLDGADYFNHAVISKDELEHGVRDLVSAGLISVAGQSFALTDAGRETWKSVWRKYEARRFGNHLIAVAEKLCASLGERDFKLDGRPFKPHLTLGRVKPRGDRDARRALEAVPLGELARFTATEIVLMQSVLGPGGAKHETRDTIRFSGVGLN